MQHIQLVTSRDTGRKYQFIAAVSSIAKTRGILFISLVTNNELARAGTYDILYFQPKFALLRFLKSSPVIQVKLVKTRLNLYYSCISSTMRRRSYGPVPFGGRGQLKSQQISINPSLILRTQPAFVVLIALMLSLDKISCPWQQIISSVIQYNQIAFFLAPQMHSII